MDVQIGCQVLLIMDYSATMLLHLLKPMIGVLRGLLQLSLSLQIQPKVWISSQSHSQQGLLKYLLQGVQILQEMLR